MPATVNRMKKGGKSGKKRSAKQTADPFTEQIVQMIASSIASLPKKERRAAMHAFDLTAEALSTHGKKTARIRKTRAPRSSPKRRKGTQEMPAHPPLQFLTEP